jgi:hypothetical protein
MNIIVVIIIIIIIIVVVVVVFIIIAVIIIITATREPCGCSTLQHHHVEERLECHGVECHGPPRPGCSRRPPAGPGFTLGRVGGGG